MDPFQDDASRQKPGLDLGMLWRAFWRRKLLFLVPAVVCLAMAGVVIKTMDPIYSSSGLLEVRMDHTRSELLTDPTQAFGRQRDLERRLESDMVNVLYSPRFLVAAVEEMKQQETGEEAPAARERNSVTAMNPAAVRLRGKISLERLNSSIYRIEVRDDDPQTAFRIASFLVPRFVQEYRLSRLAVRSSTREFLEAQRARYEAALAKAEKELNDFLQEMAANDLVGNRLNASNLASTEDRLERARARHEGPDAQEFDELARAARRVLGSDPPVSIFARDGVVKSLLLELEDLGIELLTTLESDPDFASLETRLGRLRVQLNNRVDELVAANHPQVGVMDRNRLVNYYYSYLYRSVELQVLRTVQRNIDDYRRFVTQRPIQSAELAELQEQVRSARDLVNTIVEEITREQMNFDAGMSDVGMQIMVRQDPVLQPDPVEPNKPKLWFMGAVLSLGLGVGLVVLAIFMDKSFRTVDEIEHALGIAVIGTLPLIQDEHFVRRRRLRVLRWSLVFVAVLAVAAVMFFVVYPALGR